MKIWNEKSITRKEVENSLNIPLTEQQVTEKTERETKGPTRRCPPTQATQVGSQPRRPHRVQGHGTHLPRLPKRRHRSRCATGEAATRRPAHHNQKRPTRSKEVFEYFMDVITGETSLCRPCLRQNFLVCNDIFHSQRMPSREGALFYLFHSSLLHKFCTF